MDLIQTSKLMRSQNNRGTQYPLFIIQTLEEVLKADGRGGRTVYFDGEETTITSAQFEELEDAKDHDRRGVEIDKCLNEAGLDSLDDFDPDDWERLEVSDEWVYADNAGFFFTEKACHDHIEQNRHHYNKPRSYVISAWRNPEIVATMHMILNLTSEFEGLDMPSCYK